VPGAEQTRRTRQERYRAERCYPLTVSERRGGIHARQLRICQRYRAVPWRSSPFPIAVDNYRALWLRTNGVTMAAHSRPRRWLLLATHA